MYAKCRMQSARHQLSRIELDTVSLISGPLISGNKSAAEVERIKISLLFLAYHRLISNDLPCCVVAVIDRFADCSRDKEARLKVSLKSFRDIYEGWGARLAFMRDEEQDWPDPHSLRISHGRRGSKGWHRRCHVPEDLTQAVSCQFASWAAEEPKAVSCVVCPVIFGVSYSMYNRWLTIMVVCRLSVQFIQAGAKYDCNFMCTLWENYGLTNVTLPCNVCVSM